MPGATGARELLVVDTSAVLETVAAANPDRGLLDRLVADGDLHAPHLLDIEVLNALRGLVRGGKLSGDRAADARADIAELAIVRYGHEPLADRIWGMRANLTAYDAAFVALAEALDVPLVTCDRRLASAPGHAARFEIYGAA